MSHRSPPRRLPASHARPGRVTPAHPRLLLVRPGPAAPAPESCACERPPTTQAVTVDPLLGRPLLALALGLVLIVAGLILDAPLALLERLTED